MQFEPHDWYHVYNRGNNRQRIFFSSRNYLFFLKKIRNQIVPHANVIAYCLMPNHFHLLLHIKPVNNNAGYSSQHPLNQKVGIILRSYAQAINNQEDRSGSLFRGRTNAKNLSEGDRNYAFTCFHYIHQNPLKAGLVGKLEDWPFSSYRDFAGLRDGTLPEKNMAYKAFDITDEQHFIECSRQQLNPELIQKIF